ncbi:hypothetical protein VTN77DRAFT_7717 [Rasamsonia byssochlamydoides]|uniref:uncharacterized protein n=1 Tax=Rasamsonia byssochlamydoides TaxID=89139 RepID=UPI0037447337
MPPGSPSCLWRHHRRVSTDELLEECLPDRRRTYYPGADNCCAGWNYPDWRCEGRWPGAYHSYPLCFSVPLLPAGEKDGSIELRVNWIADFERSYYHHYIRDYCYLSLRTISCIDCKSRCYENNRLPPRVSSLIEDAGCCIFLHRSPDPLLLDFNKACWSRGLINTFITPYNSHTS